MPNFWSKAGQYLSEALSGNMTKDEDFESACVQMTQTESGINNLKSILKSFNSIYDPLCKYLKDLNESIKKIYKDSPFKDYIFHIVSKQMEILDDLELFQKNLAKLYSRTSEWDLIFDKAKESKKERDEKRKVFDHYEQKLLKLGDKKQKTKAEIFSRNEEKYKKAATEYLDVSEKSFDLINTSLKLSWDLVNPILGDLVLYEKKFYESISSRLVDYTNVHEKLRDIKDKTFDPDSMKDNFYYDPQKYIKKKSLMKKTVNNYVHIFIRKTNSFGKVPIMRNRLFLDIKDDFS